MIDNPRSRSWTRLHNAMDIYRQMIEDSSAFTTAEVASLRSHVIEIRTIATRLALRGSRDRRDLPPGGTR